VSGGEPGESVHGTPGLHVRLLTPVFDDVMRDRHATGHAVAE
jgi:hypothetical protein